MDLVLGNKRSLINYIKRSDNIYDLNILNTISFSNQQLYLLICDIIIMPTDLISLIVKYICKGEITYHIYYVKWYPEIPKYKIIMKFANESPIDFILNFECENNMITKLELYCNSLSNHLFSTMYMMNNTLYYPESEQELKNDSVEYHKYRFNMLYIINIFMKEHYGKETYMQCINNNNHQCMYVREKKVYKNQIINSYIHYNHTGDDFTIIIYDNSMFMIMIEFMKSVIDTIVEQLINKN